MWIAALISPALWLRSPASKPTIGFDSGNGERCLTKEAIKASIDGFFSAVDALYHDVLNLWEVGDCVFLEMDVIYWRKDKTHIKLPRAEILRFEGDKIQELRIFMDANPIFIRDMKVGDNAPHDNQRRESIKSGGGMKKFFSDHKEGIQRDAGLRMGIVYRVEPQ
jgi:hypothetical protein